MDKYRNEATTAGQTAERDLAPAKAVNVFADLCTLLEEYGPAWYSEEIHNHAQRALRLLQEVRGIKKTITARSGRIGTEGSKPPWQSTGVDWFAALANLSPDHTEPNRAERR